MDIIHRYLLIKFFSKLEKTNSIQGNNTVVKCMIKNNATEPSWQINGKNSTKDKLLILTDRYQIQPGNMCQFLPQV